MKKLIILNAIVFILSKFTNLIEASQLHGNFKPTIVGFLSLLSYSFLHLNFLHLALNMYLLYFIYQYLDAHYYYWQYIYHLYIIGAIAGAVGFIGFNTFNATSTVLIGSSAAVRCILIFTCLVCGNDAISLFKFKFKLWHFGAFLVVLDLAGIAFTNNSGGYISHLGGAAAGALFYSLNNKYFKIFN